MGVRGLTIEGNAYTGKELASMLPALPNIGERITVKSLTDMSDGEVEGVRILNLEGNGGPQAFISLTDKRVILGRAVRLDQPYLGELECYGVLLASAGKILFSKTLDENDFIPAPPIEIDREIGIRSLQRAGLLMSQTPFDDFFAEIERGAKSGTFSVQVTSDGARLVDIVSSKLASEEEMSLVDGVLRQSAAQPAVG